MDSALFEGTATHIKAGRSDTHSSATDLASLELLKARGSGNGDPVSVVVGGWSLPRQRKRVSGSCESTQTLNTASTTTAAASDHLRILLIGGSLQLLGPPLNQQAVGLGSVRAMYGLSSKRNIPRLFLPREISTTPGLS